MDLGFTLSYRSGRSMSVFMWDMPGWGEWWWYPKYTCDVYEMDENKYVQFQLDGGDSVAFLEQTGGTYRLVGQNDFGIAHSASPIEYTLQQTNSWFYLLDPRDDHVLMFQKTNFCWRIVAVTDQNDNRLIYTYAEPGSALKPSRIEDDDGRSLDLTYSDMGITHVTDHTGRCIEMIYEADAPDNDNLDCLRYLVDAAGKTNRFDYGGPTLIVKHTLPEGNAPYTQSYTNAQVYADDPYADTCVASQTDAYSNCTEFVWNINNSTLVTCWPDGGSNVFSSAGRYRPTESITAPGGGQTLFDVDDRNRITSLTDPEEQSLEFVFDSTNALLTAVTNSMGESLRFDYAAADQVITNPVATGESVVLTFRHLTAIHYPDGTSETFTYDGNGNVTSSTDRAGGEVTRCEYDAHGNLICVKAPDGSLSEFQYDAMSRMIGSTDADGVINQYSYDALDRMTNRVNGAGCATGFAYDEIGRIIAITDPLGNEACFTYDDNGNLVATTDRDGAIASTSFDLMNRVIAVSNTLGGVATSVYDEMNRLAEIIVPGGMTNVFQRNYQGLVTNVIRAGESVAYTYDAEGRPVSQTSARGYIATFVRDVDGQLIAVTNALGQTVRFDRDADGRVTHTVDALNHITTAVFDEDELTTSIDAEGRTTHYAYNAKGQLALLTAPGGAQTAYGYTSAGRLAAITNSLGYATRYAYDAAGRLETETDPLGRETSRAYDAAGRLSIQTDAFTNNWSFAYDPESRITAFTNPLGGIAETTYRPGGYLSTRTDSETGVWSNQWNAAGQRIADIDPLGHVTRYAYDNFTRLAAKTNALGYALQYAYNSDGNLICTTDSLGAELRTAYDAIGQVTSVTDRIGGISVYTYDAAGRLIESRDPDGIVTETEYDATGLPVVRCLDDASWINTYDAAGRLESTTSPLGYTRTNHRDALGRVTNRIDAAGCNWAYELDAAGQLIAKTDPEGRTTQYAYDARDRLVRLTLPGGVHADYERDALGNITSITDLGGQNWHREYTPMGRLVADADPLARTNTYSHDALGRLQHIVHSDGGTLDIQRDAIGQVTGRVWSAGLTLEYTYDAAGRLSEANGIALEYDAAGHSTNAIINGCAYTAGWTQGGRLASVAYNNNAITVNYEYDAANGLLTAVSDTLTGIRLTFEYDLDRRLVAIRRPNSIKSTFAYDSAGRIDRLTDGTILDIQYAYDAAGRLVSETRNTPKPTFALLQSHVETNEFDAASQLTGSTAATDTLGRRTADDRHAYTWHADNRLAAVDGITFQYDALGNITTRDAIPFACHPAIAGSPLVDDNATWYVWTPGGALLYSVSHSTGHAVHHYHFDRSGHVLVLTDAAGTVAETYAYAPDGLELNPAPSAIGNPFRFLGRYGIRAEGNAGDLYHIRSRWYDARTGVFLSKEPLWPQIQNPQALNPYLYASADPVNNVDINGERDSDTGSAWEAQYENATEKIGDLWRAQYRGEMQYGEAEHEQAVIESKLPGFYMKTARDIAGGADDDEAFAWDDPHNRMSEHHPQHEDPDVFYFTDYGPSFDANDDADVRLEALRGESSSRHRSYEENAANYHLRQQRAEEVGWEMDILGIKQDSSTINTLERIRTGFYGLEHIFYNKELKGEAAEAMKEIEQEFHKHSNRLRYSEDIATVPLMRQATANYGAVRNAMERHQALLEERIEKLKNRAKAINNFMKQRKAARLEGAMARLGNNGFWNPSQEEAVITPPVPGLDHDDLVDPLAAAVLELRNQQKDEFDRYAKWHDKFVKNPRHQKNKAIKKHIGTGQKRLTLWQMYKRIHCKYKVKRGTGPSLSLDWETSDPSLNTAPFQLAK